MTDYVSIVEHFVFIPVRLSEVPCAFAIKADVKSCLPKHYENCLPSSIVLSANVNNSSIETLICF